MLVGGAMNASFKSGEQNGLHTLKSIITCELSMFLYYNSHPQEKWKGRTVDKTGKYTDMAIPIYTTLFSVVIAMNFI